MNDAPSSLSVQIKLAAKYVVQPPSGESVSSIPTLSSKITSIQDSPVALINPLPKRRAKSIEKPYLSGPQMQLVAKIDQMRQAKLEAFIRLPGIPTPEPITFLVDTGCSATCLLPDDVIRLNVKHESLPTVMKSIVTANGPVSLKLLQNVIISLPVRRGLLDRDGYVHVPMSQLSFLPPGPSFKALPSTLIFSLLGMDVLHHFPKWRWGRTELVMEELNQSLEELKMSFKL